jgi:hypothetical protein
MLILENRHHEYRVPVYASSYFSPNVSDYKESLRKVQEHDKKQSLAKVAGRTIDYNWLRGAAESYQLSDKIEDYILTEVPAVTIGIPNRNLHCFPYEEVTYFDPRFGKFVYQTFVGKSAYADHSNKNPLDSKGIIFDAYMRKVPGWDVWKIYTLVGYDRTKDPTLAKQIESGQRRSYSMGCWVSYFINSITGQISNGSQTLKYPVGTVVDGRLSYLNCSGCDYFELSSVEGPADVTAESNQLWYF